ncbi:MAG: hypothetical protein AB7V27_19545, partial [Candidatus Binatia bacterium]
MSFADGIFRRHLLALGGGLLIQLATGRGARARESAGPAPSTPRMSASDQRFIEGLTDLVARVLTALMAFSDALRRLEPHAV